MKLEELIVRFSLLAVLFVSCAGTTALAQESAEDEEFGPVVRAYLGYLRNEMEVVDDRASRREISQAYYRHNANRIRALREMAIRIARETQNDYLPELEAVSRNEFTNLFEKPPKPQHLRAGLVIEKSFRFLGTVRTGELFYIFARLDPYEQAELIEKERTSAEQNNGSTNSSAEGEGASGASTARPRRASAP